MGVLVDDDAGLKVTVSVRSGGVPDVHPHLAVLAVRGGGEAGEHERSRSGRCSRWRQEDHEQKTHFALLVPDPS